MKQKQQDIVNEKMSKKLKKEVFFFFQNFVNIHLGVEKEKTIS